MGNNPSRPSGTSRSRSHFPQDRSYSKNTWSSRPRRGYGTEEDMYDAEPMALREEQARQQPYGSPFPNMPQQGYYGRACCLCLAMKTLSPIPSRVHRTQSLNLCQGNPSYSLSPRCISEATQSSRPYPLCQALCPRLATRSPLLR